MIKEKSYKRPSFKGNVFYITCIASKELLEGFYHDLKDYYQCLFSKDIYSQDWWLEILPKKATKRTLFYN